MAAPTQIDQLDFTVKFILAFFFGPLVMGVNRILRGSTVKGVIFIVTGGLFGIGWIIDLYTLITKKDITFFL